MEIRPFRGWRYNVPRGGDVSDFIAPPYDILSAQDKEALLARSGGNIVAVDLPYVPPKDVGPDRLYRQAAALLSRWKSSGVLKQEPQAALYAYRQSFKWAGKTYARAALLCGVRATELGKDVIPHEHTFPGPKADRLKLTQYTRMQLSPIFGFYSDPGGAAADVLGSAADKEVDLQGTLREVREKLWVITDRKVIAAVQSDLAGTPVFIADGHHRYTTGLNYCNALKADGKIDRDHEANFILFALVDRRDEGLLILPTHRVIRGLRPDFAISKLIQAARGLAWRRLELDESALSDADALLRTFGPGAMAFLGPNAGEVWIARLNDVEAMRRAAPEQLDAWRRLDVAVLHKLVIDEALTAWKSADFAIEYTPDARKVLAACKSGAAQLGACLQGTPLPAVEEIARAGASMPHKSTYFYPKLATGMVLKPLE